MKHVTIVALPDALGSTIAIPLEMLSAANDIARAGGQPDKQVTLKLASPTLKAISLVGDMHVQCDTTLKDITDTDLVFIPGLWGNPRRHVFRNHELCEWLASQHSKGAMLCGITTGTHFLAEAGLLNDKPATTHWRFFDQFQQLYPRVKLQRKRFVTHADGIFCTGSVNAARDIMLYFVEQLFGEAIANEIARHFTHELKRSYEALLLSKDQKSTHHDETIIKIQEWLQDNYSSHLQISAIATRFQISVRSLNRRFKLATNTTPLNYLQDLRIGHAKDLLKQSNLVVSEVADRVGYQDSSHFTELFKKLNAVTPNEYRRLVRNKQFIAESLQASDQ